MCHVDDEIYSVEFDQFLDPDESDDIRASRRAVLKAWPAADDRVWDEELAEFVDPDEEDDDDDWDEDDDFDDDLDFDDDDFDDDPDLIAELRAQVKVKRAAWEAAAYERGKRAIMDGLAAVAKLMNAQDGHGRAQSGPQWTPTESAEDAATIEKAARRYHSSELKRVDESRFTDNRRTAGAGVPLPGPDFRAVEEAEEDDDERDDNETPEFVAAAACLIDAVQRSLRIEADLVRRRASLGREALRNLLTDYFDTPGDSVHRAIDPAAHDLARFARDDFHIETATWNHAAEHLKSSWQELDEVLSATDEDFDDALDALLEHWEGGGRAEKLAAALLP